MDFFETEWEEPEFDSVPSLAQNMVYLLRGCDDVLVRKALQETYRDFCKRSAALRTWRKIELADGILHYPVSPLLSGEVYAVTQVVRDARWPLIEGRHWRVVGDPPVLHLAPGCRWRHLDADLVDDDTPPEFVMVETVEMPHMNEERAPKPFLRRYGDALVDGALVRLFSMSNRPWSDGEQARQHGVAYSNALSEARQSGMNGGPAANAGRGFALDLSSMV